MVEIIHEEHGALTLRTAEPLAYKPSQVFNLDESGMPLDPCPPKIIALKGIKHPTSITTCDKTQITTLAFCSAAGYVIPPLVVLDLKTLKPEMTTGEVPGTVYGLSLNG